MLCPKCSADLSESLGICSKCCISAVNPRVDSAARLRCKNTSLSRKDFPKAGNLQVTKFSWHRVIVFLGILSAKVLIVTLALGLIYCHINSKNPLEFFAYHSQSLFPSDSQNRANSHAHYTLKDGTMKTISAPVTKRREKNSWWYSEP
jgi:hypothetical protein